jgi:hypothetical protein
VEAVRGRIGEWSARRGRERGRERDAVRAFARCRVRRGQDDDDDDADYVSGQIVSVGFPEAMDVADADEDEDEGGAASNRPGHHASSCTVTTAITPQSRNAATHEPSTLPPLVFDFAPPSSPLPIPIHIPIHIPAGTPAAHAPPTLHLPAGATLDDIPAKMAEALANPYPYPGGDEDQDRGRHGDGDRERERTNKARDRDRARQRNRLDALAAQ